MHPGRYNSGNTKVTSENLAFHFPVKAWPRLLSERHAQTISGSCAFDFWVGKISVSDQWLLMTGRLWFRTLTLKGNIYTFKFVDVFFELFPSRKNYWCSGRMQKLGQHLLHERYSTNTGGSLLVLCIFSNSQCRSTQLNANFNELQHTNIHYQHILSIIM